MRFLNKKVIKTYVHIIRQATLLIKNSYLHGHDFSWFINRENNIRKVRKAFSFKFYLLIKNLFALLNTNQENSRSSPIPVCHVLRGKSKPASWFFIGTSLTVALTIAHDLYFPSLLSTFLYYTFYAFCSRIKELSSWNSFFTSSH